MEQIYEAVNLKMSEKNAQLSRQGRDTLRSYVNRDAKVAGYVEKVDDGTGWKITDEGRRFLNSALPDAEIVVDDATGKEESVETDQVLSSAFERYILELMKLAYPEHSWQHRGLSKMYERGLDLVGSRFGDSARDDAIIGVQVKYHQDSLQPSDPEWHKFLGGCFAQRVQKAIFVTTGRLSGKQQMDAVTARVMVLAGRKEITRFATSYGLPTFERFLQAADNE